MRHVLIIALAVAALLTASACGSEEQSSTTAGGSSGTTIEIVGTDFALDPSTVTLDGPGTYTFKLVNQGKTDHALEIEGHGVEESSDTVAPGETAELTVEISEDGDYELYCPVDGHKDLGMKGSIQVGAGGGGGTDTTETSSDDDMGY